MMKSPKWRIRRYAHNCMIETTAKSEAKR